MIKKSEVVEIIYQVIDTHNSTNSLENALVKDINTYIAGINGSLDSLGMITFLVEVESKINQAFGTEIKIFDEELLILNNGEYESVETLSNYILKELNS